MAFFGFDSGRKPREPDKDPFPDIPSFPKDDPFHAAREAERRQRKIQQALGKRK